MNDHERERISKNAVERDLHRYIREWKWIKAEVGKKIKEKKEWMIGKVKEWKRKREKNEREKKRIEWKETTLEKKEGKLK